MNIDFWQFFEGEASPQLALRRESLRYVFEHLDRLRRPVFIAETGCVRQAGNWAGDGQSTVLFDRFASRWDGSTVYSVDIDPVATALCRALVSSSVHVHTGDSVGFLRELARNPPAGFRHLDLLYLDSYDVDLRDSHSSALHHLKELCAAAPLLGAGTLVVIDDAPCEAAFVQSDNVIQFVTEPRVSGKAKYVAEYAKAIGLPPVFSGYQVGWVGL